MGWKQERNRTAQTQEKVRTMQRTCYSAKSSVSKKGQNLAQTRRGRRIWDETDTGANCRLQFFPSVSTHVLANLPEWVWALLQAITTTTSNSGSWKLAPVLVVSSLFRPRLVCAKFSSFFRYVSTSSATSIAYQSRWFQIQGSGEKARVCTSAKEKTTSCEQGTGMGSETST